MKCKLTGKDIRDNYVLELLSERGITDIPAFLYPNQSLLSAPELLDNMEEGAILLEEVIRNRGRIALIVDSDVDGFTSAAILINFLEKAGPNAEIDYFLHKEKQHGLDDFVDFFEEEGQQYSLIITPDAGTNDFESHERLKKRGLRFLVIDHHMLDGEISNATVMINNQTSPNYPNKSLSGAGVVFQFCRFLDKRWGLAAADDFIDLAALGIVADMMDMRVLENRYIAHEGFRNIKNPFFQALVEKQAYSMGGKVNPTTVSWYISPLINAMIRVGSQEEKERMFQAFLDGEQLVVSRKRGAKGALEKIAIESARECTNARTKQNSIKNKALTNIEKRIKEYNLLDNQILFVRLEKEDDFPPELNGLVAMTLAQQYQRPAIVARLGSDGFNKGSIRGLNESPLPSFKNFLWDSGFFEFVQGHDNAAGMSINDDNLTAFHEYANSELADMNFTEKMFNVDFIRTPQDDDLSDLISSVATLEEIWGQGNLPPLILIDNIELQLDEIQIMGAKQNTLKFNVNGVAFIKFYATDFIESLKGLDSIRLRIIGEPKINEYQGYKNNQILIREYEIIEG